MRLQSAMEYLNLLGKGSSKLQSAMEYLMTYGWAILIIAVVLGVLYYLGIFNSANLAPRLQPGSCHVARTAAGVQNFGVCAGLPEFVGQFNGQSSDVAIPSSASLNLTTSLTISAWIYMNSIGSNQNIIQKWVNTYNLVISPSNQLRLELTQTGGTPITDLFSTSTLQAGQWYYVVGTYNSSLSSNNMNLYINGVLVGSKNLNPTLNIDASPLYIGTQGGGNFYFGGAISNVQVYNASLSAAEVKALYMEGIGGAPITPQNVVGWWPLNGDANDYSGNNNNGQSTNVQYTNTWLSTYSAP